MYSTIPFYCKRNWISRTIVVGKWSAKFEMHLDVRMLTETTAALPHHPMLATGLADHPGSCDNHSFVNLHASDGTVCCPNSLGQLRCDGQGAVPVTCWRVA